MEFEKIQKIIADVLNIEPEKITMESAFVDDLNADSLDVLQIVMGIEDEFDIKIPDEATEKIVTVALSQQLNNVNGLSYMTARFF